MEWLLIVIIILIIILLGAGSYLTRVAIYPKVFPSEEIYRGEIENGHLVEAVFKTWQQREVQISSPDGYALRALYFPLEDSQKTVILSHGITMGIYQMIAFLPIFRSCGFNVIVYDLRNHGSSGGKNTTFGFYEKHDLKAVVDWAFDQLEPGGRVGTMGLSLGAGTSLQHAAIDARLSFVIADCPYSDLFDLFSQRLMDDYHLHPFPVLYVGEWIFWLITGARYRDISPRKAVEKFSTPLLLIHGQEDTYVPSRMSRELYQHKTNGIRKLWLVPLAEHAAAYDQDRKEYARQVEEFLKEIRLA
jgi:uncharacterized protein